MITQDDLLTALELIHSGYGVIGSTFEDAAFWKWVFSVFTLFWVGLYGLLVTFLLIITASDVVDLILNFTAIEFISLLGMCLYLCNLLGYQNYL